MSKEKIKNQVVKDHAEAWTAFEGSPEANTETTGHIQYKASEVFIDVNCGKCGTYCNVEGFFGFAVRCPKCKTVYSLSPFIKMVEVENPNFDNGLIKLPEYDEDFND